VTEELPADLIERFGSTKVTFSYESQITLNSQLTIHSSVDTRQQQSWDWYLTSRQPRIPWIVRLYLFFFIWKKYLTEISILIRFLAYLQGVLQKLMNTFDYHFYSWADCINCIADLDCLLSLARVSALGGGMSFSIPPYDNHNTNLCRAHVSSWVRAICQAPVSSRRIEVPCIFIW